MPRVAITETVKEIDGVKIFADLASLPDAEAKKRSETRHRNQAAAQRKKDGTVKPRGKRSETASKAPSKSLLARLGLADNPATKALHDRYQSALAAVKDEMKAAQKAFEARIAEITDEHHKRLSGAEELLKAMAIIEKLPDNAKLKTELQKRIDALA